MIILVLNVGLKNARCIAFTGKGKVLFETKKRVRTYINGDFVEQDPNEWLSLSWEVIGEVVSHLGSQSEQIKYLTVTTSASCLVAADENYKPLIHSMLVSDTRSTKEAKELECLIEFQALESMYAKSSPDLMIPKILWLQKNQPKVFKSTRYFLNVSDFLIAHLVGEGVTDQYNALKFHYILSEKCYPEKLLGALNIPIETFPKVVTPGEDVGPVLPHIRDKLNLPKNCNVIVSTYDALAAVIGNGGFNAGEAVDVSGTVTSFRVVSDNPVVDPMKRFYVVPHVDSYNWLIGGSNNLSGGIIEWIRALHYNDFPNPYEKMEEEASKSKPCPGGLLFIPHLLGERTPVWNPDSRALFFGINRAHQRQDFTRAVFEGVAYSVMHIADVLKQFNVSIDKVAVAGGVSQISLINQIKSDVLGVPIIKYKNFESTAIGAALIVLFATKYFSTMEQAFNEFCKVERIYEPNLEYHNIYSDFFNVYKKIYNSLVDVHKDRANILKKYKQKGFGELLLAEDL